MKVIRCHNMRCRIMIPERNAVPRFGKLFCTGMCAVMWRTDRKNHDKFVEILHRPTLSHSVLP
jgi:hypothetical protein